MEKTFVLDTNVILFDPYAVNKFGKNKVYIPLIVVEEVDNLKSRIIRLEQKIAKLKLANS